MPAVTHHRDPQLGWACSAAEQHDTSCTTWGRSLAQLLEYVMPPDRERWLVELGVSEAQLQDIDARVPSLAYYRAVELAEELRGDPHIGITYIAHAGFASLDAIGFLAMASRTIGESFERYVRHHRTLSSAAELRLDIDHDTVTMRCLTKLPPSRGLAHSVEMYAAGPLVLIPRMTGRPLQMRRLDFRHPPRQPIASYARLLGHEPRFGCEENAWSWSRDVFDVPMPFASQGLVGFFERYLHGAAPTESPGPVASAPPSGPPLAATPLHTEVRKVVAQLLPDGEVSLPQVAQRLGVGARTLQRRLRAEQLSFATIADEVREALAKAHLMAPLPIAEVSHLLGFAHPEVFHRAFKRWTGLAPGAWRAQQPARGAPRTAR